ncbi:MAG TPA: hypothetical protein VF029_03745 [Actinomycetota bacterium]
MQAETRNQRLAGGLVVAGGVLAVIAGFLGWADFAPADAAARKFRGVELSAGVGSLALGVALVIVGAVLFARGGRTGGRGASITAIVFAAPVLLAAGYSAVAPADALREFQDGAVAGEWGISSGISRTIEAAFARGGVEVAALVGSWVAAVGGLLALAGGIAGLIRSRRIRGQAEAAAPLAG